ncbi:alpha-ketoglutarate-dependent dioxygenase AlkB [Chryseobacterium aurantiacum]|uniref:alpha-ketoglutarate-dependent dioxygenase AlkB n=1 Tax=Chryseobacterium aurantiacum TaxID=2116499 RepID=UPI000D133734|nr:alpha-ketoglutarate-dependent dioxygenase AlkB [Chryseobacterium aurantiacum]
MSFPEFYIINLPLEENLFDPLFNSAEFESTGKGRLGNHLVNTNGLLIPIVRTTTRYAIPANAFLSIHHELVDKINDTLQESHRDVPVQKFNNALIEVYDSTYSKMNYHSDQALDLDSNSFIALFSCYEKPDKLEEFHLRKLVIKDKVTHEVAEVILHHNSVVLFSVDTNKKFQHKIILNSSSNSNAKSNNKWLGITFRTSKTYIQFKDGLPCFSTGEIFALADQDQESEFFQLRGQENRSLDFIYPNLLYTISNADLLKPIIKL